MRTTLVIDLPRPGVAFTPEGQQTYVRLEQWLERQAIRWPGARVLIRADANAVPMQDLLKVFELVRTAGFEVQLAAEPPLDQDHGGG